MKLPDPEKLRIIYYPHPILKEVCAPVDQFGPDLGAVANKMLELMREGKGIGLAAPQVGLTIRLLVCNATGEPGNDLVCVNPRFVELTGAAEGEEGCLSIPDIFGDVDRAQRVVVETTNLEGERIKVEASDLRARAIQHEIDHLDGILFLDHLSPLKRRMLMKKWKKLRKGKTGFLKEVAPAKTVEEKTKKKEKKDKPEKKPKTSKTKTTKKKSSKKE